MKNRKYFLSRLDLGYRLSERVGTLPTAPERREAPTAGAGPNFPFCVRTQKQGSPRPRAGHSVPRARPLPPSVTPHGPARQAAPQGEAEGGSRTGGKRPTAPPSSEEAERRGKRGSSGRGKGERPSEERRRRPPRPPGARAGSGARAPGQPQGEHRDGMSRAGPAEGGRPAAPGRGPGAPGKEREKGGGGRPRPSRGPAVRADQATPHLRRLPPRSTAGLSSSPDPSSPGPGPAAAYPQRIRPGRRRDREGRAPRLPPLCPHAPGAARLPPADLWDRAAAAPGASPAPLPSPHQSERRHRRGRRRRALWACPTAPRHEGGGAKQERERERRPP